MTSEQLSISGQATSALADQHYRSRRRTKLVVCVLSCGDYWFDSQKTRNVIGIRGKRYLRPILTAPWVESLTSLVRPIIWPLAMYHRHETVEPRAVDGDRDQSGSAMHLCIAVIALRDKSERRAS